MQYRVTFCCTPVCAAFGRTFCSEELPLSAMDTDGLVKVAQPVVMYFHSSIRDDSCVAIVEIVVVARRGSGRVKVGEFGVGWAALNLFSPTRKVLDWVPDDAGHPVDVGLFVGTPRALLTPLDTGDVRTY